MKKLLVFGILIHLMLSSGTVLSQSQPKKGGTLIFGRTSDSVSLDPARSSDSESSKVTESIFDGLVNYKDNSTEVSPALSIKTIPRKYRRHWPFPGNLPKAERNGYFIFGKA